MVGPIRRPELDKLITRAVDANLDLQAAASRIREAREQKSSQAPEHPQLSANGGTAARVHSNSASGQRWWRCAARPSGGPTSSSIRWGSTRAGKSTCLEACAEASKRRTATPRPRSGTSPVKCRSPRKSPQTISRCARSAAIALLRDERSKGRATLTFVQARKRAGFVTALDVNQQVSLRSSTVAQIPTLQAEAGAAEHAIAVLLAKPPETLETELNATAVRPSVPQAVAVGLPSTLLERRPDVREAERKLAAATANVGIAVADLYPKFDLLAGASLASTTSARSSPATVSAKQASVR